MVLVVRVHRETEIITQEDPKYRVAHLCSRIPILFHYSRKTHFSVLVQRTCFQYSWTAGFYVGSTRVISTFQSIMAWSHTLLKEFWEVFLDLFYFSLRGRACLFSAQSAVFWSRFHHSSTISLFVNKNPMNLASWER